MFVSIVSNQQPSQMIPHVYMSDRATYHVHNIAANIATNGGNEKLQYHPKTINPNKYILTTTQ